MKLTLNNLRLRIKNRFIKPKAAVMDFEFPAKDSTNDSDDENAINTYQRFAEGTTLYYVAPRNPGDWYGECYTHMFPVKFTVALFHPLVGCPFYKASEYKHKGRTFMQSSCFESEEDARCYMEEQNKVQWEVYND